MKHARALAAVAATFALTALVPSSAAAHSTGGLYACDYQSTYGDIPCSEVDRAISGSASEFGVDEMAMRETIRCESGFNPFATNGSYMGLFQQSTDYWGERVAEFNANVEVDVPGDYYNPFDNARVSARMWASGQDHWPNC